MATTTQIFIGSLNEADRLAIQAARSEAQITARYHDHKARLPGGHLHGGTEAEGIAMISEARDIIRAKLGLSA